MQSNGLATMNQNPTILNINNIEVIYDHVILVLKGVSLSVPRGKIVALMGANGAGKSTTLKSISTLLRGERGDVTKGSIEFNGERIDQLTPNELVRRGLSQVMEGRHCFGHLTIEENLLTGAYTRKISRTELKNELEKVYPNRSEISLIPVLRVINCSENSDFPFIASDQRSKCKCFELDF